MGYKNCVMSSNITHSAGLPNYGRETLTPRMDIDPPFVPVSWRVALFGRLGGDVDLGLGRSRLEDPEWICFTG